MITISSINTILLKNTDRSKQLIDLLAAKSLRRLIIKNGSPDHTLGMQSYTSWPTSGFTFFIRCLSKTKDSLIEISLNTQHLDLLSTLHINLIKHYLDKLKLHVLELKRCGLGKAKHPSPRDADQRDKREHLIQLFANLNYLKVLDLKENMLYKWTKTDLQGLREGLKIAPLESIHFAGNDLFKSVYGVSFLGDILQDHPRLKKVDFSKNRMIPDEETELLSQQQSTRRKHVIDECLNSLQLASIGVLFCENDERVRVCIGKALYRRSKTIGCMFVHAARDPKDGKIKHCISDDKIPTRTGVEVPINKRAYAYLGMLALAMEKFSQSGCEKTAVVRQDNRRSRTQIPWVITHLMLDYLLDSKPRKIAGDFSKKLEERYAVGITSSRA